MELIDNINKTLAQDLKQNIRINSKVSIAASCFSIYAYQELKEQLENIEELRFIFTSPTFNTEKAKKEKREFYIPKLNRERSLYGTEFEILFNFSISFFVDITLINEEKSFESSESGAVNEGSNKTLYSLIIRSIYPKGSNK